MRRSVLFLLAAGASIPALAAAAPAADQAQAASRAAVHGYGGLALSPAGDEMASIETGAGGRSPVTVRSAADGRILRLLDPCATCSYAAVTYGPAGRLAFVARDRAAGTATLEVAEDGRVTAIATVPGLASTLRFSPDGTRLAALVTLGAAKESGATQAGVRQIGEIGEKNDEQRIAVFALGRPAARGAAIVPVSPAGRYVYEYDWTPDGRGFVATTALGNGDNNWWIATIDLVDAQTGAVRRIAKPMTQANFPRVSPDGATVAYVGGLMSDFGSVGGDVWTVPLAGGTPRDITPGYKASVTSIAWTAGGLRGTALAGADLRLVAIDPARGATTLWSRPASLAAGDGRAAWSRDGKIAAASVQDYEHAPSLWAGAAAGLRQVTHDNDAVPATVAARSVTWRNEGFTVQGWLLSPLGASPAAKAPMIVEVHGGPAAANTPSYVGPGGGIGDLVHAGYYVFLPNPRGSYGQGEAFTAANRRDFGGGDLRDILTGIDAVEKVAPVDDSRLGLTGGSYGGFMSMWANTQTNRFKAIVAGAGLSNWVSYYGTNGIDQWMLPYFGKTLYEDLPAYEKPSAIYQIAKARTPTFIYVGERDIEVPPTQSVEYWHALHDRGVATSLVIYPDEGHGIRQPDHVEDVRRRALAWFARYLGAPARP